MLYKTLLHLIIENDIFIFLFFDISNLHLFPICLNVFPWTKTGCITKIFIQPRFLLSKFIKFSKTVNSFSLFFSSYLLFKWSYLDIWHNYINMFEWIFRTNVSIWNMKKKKRKKISVRVYKTNKEVFLFTLPPFGIMSP